MTATELVANAANPGQLLPLCSLLEAMPASTPGSVESYAVSAPAPFALRLPPGDLAAQFRVVVDEEYLIVAASADGSSPWTFTRGAENSPPMEHLAGASVYFALTAGGIKSLIEQQSETTSGGNVNGGTP